MLGVTPLEVILEVTVQGTELRDLVIFIGVAVVIGPVIPNALIFGVFATKCAERQVVQEFVPAVRLKFSNPPGTEGLAPSCEDPAHCALPYVRVAGRETWPFRDLGRVMSKDHPSEAFHRLSLAQFPNVRACLRDEGRVGAYLDLTAIDWQAFWTHSDFAVCLYWVSESIGDPEGFRQLLRRSGIDMKPMRTPASQRNWQSGPTSHMNAFIPIDDYWDRYTATACYWICRVRRMDLTVFYSEGGETLDIELGSSIK